MKRLHTPDECLLAVSTAVLGHEPFPTRLVELAQDPELGAMELRGLPDLEQGVGDRNVAVTGHVVEFYNSDRDPDDHGER